MQWNNTWLLVIAIVVIALVPLVWQVHAANERAKAKKRRDEARANYVPPSMVQGVAAAPIQQYEPLKQVAPAPVPQQSYSREGPKKGKDGKERYMIYELDVAGHKHLLFTHMNKEKHDQIWNNLTNAQ